MGGVPGIPPVAATDWDVTIMARLDPAAEVPDLLAHAPLMTCAVHDETFGLQLPEHSISMTPNVTRPRSRGAADRWRWPRPIPTRHR